MDFSVAFFFTKIESHKYYQPPVPCVKKIIFFSTTYSAVIYINGCQGISGGE